MRYNRREGTALVTVETVHGAPVAGFRTRLFQFRWIVGEPRSMYPKTLGVKATDARGEVTFKVPRWKHSTECGVGLVENPGTTTSTAASASSPPAGCG